MSNNEKNINHCLTRQEILDFKQGNMEADRAHQVKQHIASCELCSDAMEGYTPLTAMEINHNWKALDRKISYKHTSSGKLQLKKNMVLALAAAASIASIIVVTKILNKPLYNDYNQISEYRIELSDNFTPPPPPKTQLKHAHVIEKEAIISEVNESQAEPDEDQEIIVIKKKNPLNNPRFGNREQPADIILKRNQKTVERKASAEGNIVIPKEKIRYGYSYNNKIITVQFDGEKYGKTSNGKALPSFQNQGLNGFMNYINKNLKYPKEAYVDNIQGTVLIHFTVSKAGRVSDVKLVNGVHPSVNKEAVRVIKDSPIWFPGTIDNNPVDVQLSCPVTFVIK